MKRSSAMTGGAMGLMIALLMAARGAEDPATKAGAVKPQWQRMLQGEDAKKAAEQEIKLVQFLEKGKLAEALKQAESLVQLRSRLQGADHWQAVDMHFTVEAIHRLLKASKEDQQSYVRSVVLKPKVQALYDKGRYREAQPLFEQALAIRRKILGEDHPSTAKSYNNLANNRSDRGRYKEAEEDYRKALSIYRRTLGEESLATAAGYNNLASNLHAQGKYAEAEENYRKALIVCRKLLGEEHFQTAAIYGNMAQNLSEQGKHRQAQQGLQKALAIRRKRLGEEHPHTALSYNNLAISLNEQGKYKEAEEDYRKALAIRRKILGEEHRDTATSYNNLAVNLQDQRKYNEAGIGYGKALAIRRNILGEEHPLTADSHNNVANNLYAQGKYREAEEGFRKALAICRKVLGEEHPKTASSYNNWASNLSALGRHREAQQGLQKALALRRKLLGEEHPDTADTYNNMAFNLYLQGKYQEADENLHRALAIRLKSLGPKHPNTAASYNNLARNCNAQGNYKEAEIFFIRAADSFAQVRLHVAATGLERAAFSSERSPLPALAAVLARNGKPEEAWQRFEESLARGTWDDLSARILRPQTERDKETQILARIDRLQKRVEKASAAKPTNEPSKQREQLLSQLRHAYDELAAFTQQLEQKYGPITGQVFPRGQIQASLSADSALLAWLDIAGQAKAVDPNDEHWAILLRSTGPPVWVRLTGSGEKGAWTDADTKLPARLGAALQTSRGLWQPLAQRLCTQRLDPLAPHLKGVRRLIVLPSTTLAGVPLEVIADDYTISYAHSGTMYAHLRGQRPATGEGLFVLADPVFDPPSVKEKPQRLAASGGGEDGKWSPLPGSRNEAASLLRVFNKKAPVQALLGSEASEQRLNDLAKRGELSKYRYLHLATHGEVDNVFPLRSAVILSRDRLPDEKQRTEMLASGQPIPDGRLQADEALRRWNLHADLVTLSACQTALGKYERGEGFVGFAQSLILCGTRSVCLSLWKVDDTATALLMERFYQNLLGKREGLKAAMPKAAALAEAKAWLRNLSSQEVLKLAAALTEGVSRSKPTKSLDVPPVIAKAKAGDRPYAHPYYWAAFILIGQAD